MNRILRAGAALAMMFLVFGCEKEKRVNTPSPSTPTTPYVDTMALLTAHPWYYRWVGRDDNKDGEMDSLIYPRWEHDEFTIKADGSMCITGYIADTVFYNRCGTWKFIDADSSQFVFEFNVGAEEFKIHRINDTSLVVYNVGWKVMSAYKGW